MKYFKGVLVSFLCVVLTLVNFVAKGDDSGGAMGGNPGITPQDNQLVLPNHAVKKKRKSSKKKSQNLKKSSQTDSNSEPLKHE